MKGIFCLLVLILQLVCFVCVSSRPFAPKRSPAVLEDKTLDFPITQNSTLQSNKNRGIEAARNERDAAAEYSEITRIGSSPPSCRDKCFGCMPCEATQVPTTSGRVGVQYTNYEPEGWKCKCGPAFYTP